MVEIKEHWPQHCIRAIAGKVVKSRSEHLVSFSGGGQVIAWKPATALILDRWAQLLDARTKPS